jgi:hypothetical protein
MWPIENEINNKQSFNDYARTPKVFPGHCVLPISYHGRCCIAKILEPW